MSASVYTQQPPEKKRLNDTKATDSRKASKVKDEEEDGKLFLFSVLSLSLSSPKRDNIEYLG